ncbi:MAG: UxaA family hydrolase [Candidatus Latescibacterota bacterium]|nr:UxaA family hydrolase [Candidatus Latescibacterota bacterium]
MTELNFADAGRLPLEGDNVAIATRRLEAGTKIEISQGEGAFELSHTVMEGHRFAVVPIASGSELLSWELPFGVSLRDIEPGEYVCNLGMLEALRGRSIDFELPEAANFQDRIVPYELPEKELEQREQVPLVETPRTFCGFDRGARGAGTRNFIVVLGTNSRTAAFARLLVERFDGVDRSDGFDGVVAVAHTEGGGPQEPNNKELLLRTLAAFAVHPNVGALLAVDYGYEPVSNRHLLDYLRQHRYAIGMVPHRFLTIRTAFQEALADGEQTIRAWIDGEVGSAERSEIPASKLKLALQCGGSDAFSGISGNPLAAWSARELIRNGGAANLAETDELIGAEPYVLKWVRDRETANKFLHMVERFKERAAWHGASAEGNPSGGNKYRGLYNIVLKSIGAAMKRHPDVRLDHCIDYSEPMREPGYYFMDSPGNDLESIAGQVASGSNVIYFVTGNGSITNFPFVPTVKIVTTSSRFELLGKDMDVNAGAYQDGADIDELGGELFEHTLRVASGERSLGERAGHSQVSIWRDWPQQSAAELQVLIDADAPSCEPLPVRRAEAPSVEVTALKRGNGQTTDRIGLVVPTSLCSGQIARMAVERLQQRYRDGASSISRFATLVHTEGCGVGGKGNEEIYARTLTGYATHPLVDLVMMLEHGCEKTHNDYMRSHMQMVGVDVERFGYASVQMDGGIVNVLDKIDAWFAQKTAALEPAQEQGSGAGVLRLGLLTAGPLSSVTAGVFAKLTRWVISAGGTIVIPNDAGLGSDTTFASGLDLETPLPTTLAHGQPYAEPGLYVMDALRGHWTETVTGLGATGVEILIAGVAEHPVVGHPFLPMLQVTDATELARRFEGDFDLVVGRDSAQKLLELIVQVASRRYRPCMSERGNTDFQITRGLLGVSL